MLVLTRVVTVVGAVEFVISLADILPQPMKDIEIKDNAIVKNIAFLIKTLLNFNIFIISNRKRLFNIYRRQKDDFFAWKINFLNLFYRSHFSFLKILTHPRKIRYNKLIYYIYL